MAAKMLVRYIDLDGPKRKVERPGRYVLLDDLVLYLSELRRLNPNEPEEALALLAEHLEKTRRMP